MFPSEIQFKKKSNTKLMYYNENVKKLVGGLSK